MMKYNEKVMIWNKTGTGYTGGFERKKGKVKYNYIIILKNSYNYMHVTLNRHKITYAVLF